MALADTQSYGDLVIEVEFDPDGDPGTYTRICGTKNATVSRTKNLDSVEVPDCANEDQAWVVKKSTRSSETSISGEGQWALQSWPQVHDWYHGSPYDALNVRIRHKKVTADGSVGDPETETGPAILSRLDSGKDKSAVTITASYEIQFAGPVVVGDKAS